MRISIELVPRGVEALEAECQAIRRHLPAVTTVNIPDLMRFDLRSWQGCHCAKPFFGHTIPHIRSIDFDLRQPLPIGPFLVEHQINEVLVVTGDAPADMSRVVYPTSSVDLIAKLKRELPHLRVYAALDPYRSGFRDEVAYTRRKLDAGADGIFTQPFFDMRLMSIYADLLPDVDVYWGVTPVLTDRSRGYWETRNQAVFPTSFRPTLEWNRQFAREALEFVRGADSSIYFMPIRVDAVTYLKDIL